MISNKESINDVIIEAHLIGSLILAHALNQGTCKWGGNSNEWVVIQGPMAGSRTVDSVQQNCNKGGGDLPKIPGVLMKIVGKFMDRFPVQTAMVSMSFQRQAYCNAQLDKHYREV